MGFSRAVVAGGHVYVAGTAPIPADGSPRPRTRTSRRACVSRSSARRSEQCGLVPRRRRADAGIRHGARSISTESRGGTRGGIRRDPAGKRAVVTALLDRVEGRDRGGSRARFRMTDSKQAFPPSITGKGAVHGGSVLDHAFGSGDPYTLGVEEEYQLLDGASFDLVQHIDTMLAAVSGHELRGARRPRAHAVGRRDHDPRLPDRGRRRRRSSTSSAATSPRSRGDRAPRRLGGDSPVRPLRAPAHHGEGPLPRGRRPDAVRRAARADLRNARPRRGRRPREGDQSRERPAPSARAATRAVRELAVLARRGDRPRVEPADGVLRVPTLGAAAALPRLRRLRRRRRAARALGLHPRLHPHLVGHPPAPAPRHGRDPDLRRGHAGRGRSRDRGLLPGAREAALGALRRGRGDPLVPPDPDEREQVARPRYGLEAPVMDIASGRRNRIPVSWLVRLTLAEIAPHARDLGSERELEGIEDILSRGSSADRQLRVHGANRDIVEVASDISDATEALPSPV